MIVRHHGAFVVERGQQEVFNFLSDPAAFGPLLPGFESVQSETEGEWMLRLRVGVSHLKGTAQVRLRLARAEAPENAWYEGSGSMLGGSVRLGAEFSLAPHGTGTEVHWKGEAQVAGRLAAMARGLLDPLAKKNIQSVIDAIQEALVNQ